MKAKLVILVLVLLLSLYSASAFVIIAGSNRLELQDCGFVNVTTTPFSCGSTVFYECIANDKYAVPGNMSVLFTFKRQGDGSQSSVAGYISRYVGSNPVFTAGITISPLLNYNGTDSYSVTSITVSDPGNSASCTQTNLLPNPFQTSGCYMTRNVITGYSTATACTCGTLTNLGSCNITDTQTISFSSNSQLCSGLTGNTQSDCSYCDPQWLGWYTQGCYVNGVTTMMIGNGSFEYFHGSGQSPNGQACCQATSAFRGLTHFDHNNGLASDCTPPEIVGSATQSCMVDAWLGRGKSPDSYNTGVKTDIEFNKGAPSFFRMDAVATGTSKIQPLVGDVEGDGLSEIVVYQGSQIYSYIVKRDANSPSTNKFGYVTLKKSKDFSSDGITFFGQPSIVGLNYESQLINAPSTQTDQMGFYYCADGTYPSCGTLKIAIFGTNQTSLKRTLYVLNGSDFSILASYVPTIQGLYAQNEAELYGAQVQVTAGCGGSYAEISDDTGIACVRDAVSGTRQNCYFTTYLNRDYAYNYLLTIGNFTETINVDSGINCGGVYNMVMRMDNYKVGYDKLMDDPRS